jgi:hypothetical protein
MAGFGACQAGAFLEFTCKPAPGMLPARPPTARPPSAPGSFPAAAALPGAAEALQRLGVRSGHSLTPAGAQLLVFGGQLSAPLERLSSSLLRLDRERMAWHGQVGLCVARALHPPLCMQGPLADCSPCSKTPTDAACDAHCR